MFRHTTKQKVRSQEYLRRGAASALEKSRQVLCSTVYENTYGVPLPPASVGMLNNIVIPLTGCNSEVQGDTRRLYTTATFDHAAEFRLRLCFIQPEVSSSTAVASSARSGALNEARSQVVHELNNPSPGRIAVSKEKCQVAGRISPYVVEKSGLGSTVEWTYFNASKSRFFYILSSKDGAELMSMTKETISIYQSFCVKGCMIVYASSMRCFKVTASPDDAESDESPNKSTCIFLYCDGTFKVLGTPHKCYKVCALFRDTVLKAHSSSLCPKVIASLCALEEPGSQPKG
jgi:hypothetical protein